MSSPRDSPELPSYDINNNQPAKDLSEKCSDSLEGKVFLSGKKKRRLPSRILHN